MASSSTKSPYTVACHCKSITITLPCKPGKVNECQCSVCYSYGAIWAYFTRKDVIFSDAPTAQYDRHGRGDMAFYRCVKCGNMLYWAGLGEYSGDEHMVGINMRMVPRIDLAECEWKFSDGPKEDAKKEDFLEE